MRHGQASLTTPVGPVTVEANGVHLTALRWGMTENRDAGALLREALAQLDAYFSGRLRFFDLPLAPAATVRGAALRAAILAVPFGKVKRYATVAARIGSSPRALGQACARNPFPILIPCHRVIGAAGMMTPYSAGDGPPTRRQLLVHEGYCP